MFALRAAEKTMLLLLVHSLLSAAANRSRHTALNNSEIDIPAPAAPACVHEG
jgi:hypothetical protein